MKRFVMVAVLTFALSGVVLAGEMPISGIVNPQPSIAETVVLTLISLLRF